MSVKRAFLKLKPEDGDIIFLDLHVVDMQQAAHLADFLKDRKVAIVPIAPPQRERLSQYVYQLSQEGLLALLGKDVKYEDGKIIIFTGEQHGVSTDCKRTEPGKAGEGTGTGSHPESVADLKGREQAAGEGNVGGGSG